MTWTEFWEGPIPVLLAIGYAILCLWALHHGRVGMNALDILDGIEIDWGAVRVVRRREIWKVLLWPLLLLGMLIAGILILVGLLFIPAIELVRWWLTLPE